MWWQDPQHATQLQILAAGAAVLLGGLAIGPHSRPVYRRGIRAVALAIALVAVAAYMRFGDFHGYGKHGQRTYHYHDIYHYAVGAKYYPELRYDLLYECTWVAFQELAPQGVVVPDVVRIRSLRSPDRFYAPGDRLDRVRQNCRERFTPERWDDFRGTIHTFLQMPWGHPAWRVMLADLGFNPPPSWALIAHNVADRIRYTPRSMEALPFIDIVLITVVGGALVWRAFGWRALAAYLVVFGTNWMASYRWTGGSYFRQVWFVFLTCGVSLLHLRAFAAAGAALALAVLMRMFPAVFVLGALLALARAAWDDPARRRDLRNFVAAGVVTTIVVVGLSALQFGPEMWQRFQHKMGHHGTSWFMWHIGFKKYATYYPEVVAAADVQLAKGWMWAPARVMDDLWSRALFVHEAIRIGLTLLVLGLAPRRPPAEAALLTGAVLLFLWAMPANYYYVYLALVPAVFYAPGSWLSAARVGLVFAALFSVSLAPYLFVEPYDQQGWWNRTVFWFLVAFLATCVAELPPLRRPRPGDP